VPTKLWRRISSSSPNRRASCEIDMINIKLRKMAIDVLEWNHDEVRFAMEGRLLYTQPTDSNWKKARTIKLTPVNALLVTNGKVSGGVYIYIFNRLQIALEAYLKLVYRLFFLGLTFSTLLLFFCSVELILKRLLQVLSPVFRSYSSARLGHI